MKANTLAADGGVRMRARKKVETYSMFDAADELAEIEKRGVLGVRDRTGEIRHDYNKIERGIYVPDEAHIEICLHCTRKTCTGYCRLMSKNTRKKREKQAEKLEQDGDI